METHCSWFVKLKLSLYYRLSLLFSLFLFCLPAIGQLPIYTTPSPPNNGNTSAQYWSRAGNYSSSGTNLNNIFGTLWNSAIYTVTDNDFRMKLNANQNVSGVVQYAIDGYNVFGNTPETINTSGYLLLGRQGLFQTNTNTNIYENKGAFSLLHLNGGALIQQNGYRPWMKTGITLTDNQDLTYIGLRQIGSQVDYTETVINWSDNQTEIADEMAFRFTGSSTGSTAISTTNLRTTTDLDGLHVARYTANGRYGLGNTFGYVAAPGHPSNLYISPQSLFHMSYDRQVGANDESYGFMQITYRDPNNIIGSGETAFDGLRFGIDNTTNMAGGINHLSGYLRWQENSPFIIQSDFDNQSGGIEEGERIRILSVSSPGVPNPNNIFTANTTRVAISHNGSSPVTEPRSLLHLGYNTSSSNSNDGWRSWMDIGTFTANGSDNMYVGLKKEGTDRFDAVINWGDNQNIGVGGVDGPDNLRFIFTSTNTGFPPGDPVSLSSNGLEVARMVPTLASTLLPGNYGMVGIGNFSLSSLPIDAKLDVDGDIRIRQVTQDNTLERFLVIDPTDLNRVHWKEIQTNSGFVSCSDQSNASNLNSDSKVNLNNYNLFFEKNDLLNKNHVGIGYSCDELLPGKLSVKQTHPATVNQSTSGIYAFNNDVANTNGLFFIGTNGIAEGVQTLERVQNIGGNFEARNANFNYGAKVIIDNNQFQNTTLNTGIYSRVVDENSITNKGAEIYCQGASTNNIGIAVNVAPKNIFGGSFSIYSKGGEFITGDHVKQNVAVEGRVTSLSVSAQHQGSECIGVAGIAEYGNVNIGVYGEADPSNPNNFAGYFSGAIATTLPPIWISDSTFKRDINPVQSGLELISKLNAKTFYFDTVAYGYMGFNGKLQYGFVANEVESVLPELVSSFVHPSKLDSLGNEITPSTQGKGMNYIGLIPINTQAIKELNGKFERSSLSDESLKLNVTNLTNSLDKVLNMRGVNFKWDTLTRPDLNLDTNMHVGFIAQEIAAIDPLLTYVDKDTLMHVKYDKVVPIIAESIEELNNKIVQKDSLIDSLKTAVDQLNQRLTTLENCLSNLLPILCQANQLAIQQTPNEIQETLRTSLKIELKNKHNIILDQNVPNPFAESTAITFFIPVNVLKAQILFYTSEGKLIETLDIHERGNGQINVYASDLSSGNYTYSLIADGVIVDTKRMIKQ